MKRPTVATVVSVVLYAGSLAAVGFGAWMIGGGNWSGAGLVVPGAMVWVDLLAASRMRVPRAKVKA